MRNMMKKAAQNVKAVAVRAGMLMKDTKGENYVDTAVKILIAVVLGALLLACFFVFFCVAPGRSLCTLRGCGDAYPYPENSGHV